MCKSSEYKWNSFSLYYETRDSLIHKDLVMLYFGGRTEFEMFMGDEVDSREIDHNFIEWNVKEKSRDFYNLWEILRKRMNFNDNMDEALKEFINRVTTLSISEISQITGFSRYIINRIIKKEF